MLNMKAAIVITALSFVLNGAGALSCDAKKNNNARNVNQATNTSAPANTQTGGGGASTDASGNLKVLAQGQYGRVSNAFVAVARGAETYAALREIIKELPAVEQDFFKTNAVVAAFLGERRTGGYNLAIARAGDKSLRIQETTPPRDAMLTQALTYPYMVVAVPLENEESLALEMGQAWRGTARSYRVKEGEFTMTGGITGRSEKFRFAGDIAVLREGRLTTFVFNLQSSDGAKARALRDAASGLSQSDGGIVVGHLGAGSFVDPPADALRATGQLNENNLSLAFDSIPGIVADGFKGSGKLTAEAAAKSK